jgi:PAS domain S-box-containing protein
MPERRDTSQSRSRRRQAEAVADLSELFHLLIENVRDYAIFILDTNGRAVTWNAGVKRMLGYDEPEFMGLHFRRLFRADEQEGAEPEMEKATTAGRSDDERWHVRKDGSEVWIAGVLTALRDPAGQLRGFVKIMRDTTAQRQAALEREDLLRREFSAREQAERANRAKDEFLAIVSHELRTPLNAILGWARMLATDHLDLAQTKRAVATIERNAKAQAQLVADLLDVSRIVTGKLQLNLQTVSLQQVTQAAVESMHHAAAVKAITISTAMAGSPAPIEGDAARLQQVILNLLSNAIRFTPTGGAVTVNIERDQEHVELTVQDTGQGVSSGALPHIFDRFEQAGSRQTPTSGLGLGLTIARHIIEAHRGSIEARSDGEGKGATFVVRLPKAQGVIQTVEPVVTPSVPQIECPPELHGKSVLVVEDQPDSQELAAFVLAHCGMRVLTADSAQGALEILNQEFVDVIVSDIRLSGEGDGFELIRAIRAHGEPYGRLPAIVVSAHANSDDQARALAAGYELHVAKPVEPSDLLAAVSALLRSRTKPSTNDTHQKEINPGR